MIPKLIDAMRPEFTGKFIVINTILKKKKDLKLENLNFHLKSIGKEEKTKHKSSRGRK